MPLTAADPTFADPTLVVVPWYDEVVDPIGHDPRSQYVELFWLNVLGPTTTCEISPAAMTWLSLG